VLLLDVIQVSVEMARVVQEIRIGRMDAFDLDAVASAQGDLNDVVAQRHHPPGTATGLPLQDVLEAGGAIPILHASSSTIGLFSCTEYAGAAIAIIHRVTT